MVTSIALPVILSWGGGFAGLWGYLDPGSGSVALQILLAGLLSAGFCLRSWIRHLKESFTTKNSGA
jgi:hypothetical protein